jgi:ribonucleotide monophosphatase NagD (HAD superfamily)
MALSKAEDIAGHKIVYDRVMAIGDSVRTDLKGARTVGIDFLFVTSGILAEELGSRENPDADALTATFVAAGGMPKAVMRELRW